MAVTASILICTRNRLAQLKKTLQTMEALRLPAHLDAELVVVDNGSTDGTAAWVKEATLPNMPVRRVEEPRAGTGYARTTAMYAARGDILLFTDDDVRVPPDWVEALCAPILEGEADVVGGTSKLADHLHRPWMEVFHRATLSSTEKPDSGATPAPITISLALHRRVLERVPAFDPELGPGSKMGFLEDTLFARQLQEAGFRIAQVDDVPVIHHPSKERLRRAAFLRAARVRGRSKAYVRYHWLHWDAWDFSHRTAWYEIWRHPYLVVLKRGLHLMLWRLLHINAVVQDEGIEAHEFRLVNLLYQARQYLIERNRPRNYKKKGLVKRRGIRPDVLKKSAHSETGSHVLSSL